MEKLNRLAAAIAVGGGLTSLAISSWYWAQEYEAYRNVRQLSDGWHQLQYEYEAAKTSAIDFAIAIPPLVWAAYFAGAWVWSGRRPAFTASAISVAASCAPVLGGLVAVSNGGSANSAWWIGPASAVVGAAFIWVLARALLPRRLPENDGGNVGLLLNPQEVAVNQPVDLGGSRDGDSASANCSPEERKV